MTEYKPRTTEGERTEIVKSCAISGDSYHCDDILYDLAHAESCLKERDAEIERLKELLLGNQELTLNDMPDCKW